MLQVFGFAEWTPRFSVSYVIIGGVVTGASWYVYRLATGPTGASILASALVCHVTHLFNFYYSHLDQGQPYPMEHHQAGRGN